MPLKPINALNTPNTQGAKPYGLGHNWVRVKGLGFRDFVGVTIMGIYFKQDGLFIMVA